MPFRTMVQDGVLMSDDLDFLQDIYDAATRGFMNVDDLIDACGRSKDDAILPRGRAGQGAVDRSGAG